MRTGPVPTCRWSKRFWGIWAVLLVAAILAGCGGKGHRDPRLGHWGPGELSFEIWFQVSRQGGQWAVWDNGLKWDLEISPDGNRVTGARTDYYGGPYEEVGRKETEFDVSFNGSNYAGSAQSTDILYEGENGPQVTQHPPRQITLVKWPVQD
jgi:hypothetical protein